MIVIADVTFGTYHDASSIPPLLMGRVCVKFYQGIDQHHLTVLSSPTLGFRSAIEHQAPQHVYSINQNRLSLLS